MERQRATQNLCRTNADLLTLVNQHYALRSEAIRLHRAGAGRVYYLKTAEGRKVLKLCRPACADEAAQAADILAYLGAHGFPVVRLRPASDGRLHIPVPRPDGVWTATLFDYAEGVCIGFLHRWRDGAQPPVHPQTAALARSVGRMHKLMEGYPNALIPKGRARYVDDFIAALRLGGHDEAKVRDLESYGHELWAALEAMPGGFCHGDMHTGNTRYRGGAFTWMDFDRAGRSHPVIDLGWLTDGTDFNAFDDGALERSRRLFEPIFDGYTRERSLSQGEITAVFGCTALIHYDLFTSYVVHKHGTVTRGQLDEQHGWLMRWRELYEKM